MSCENMWFCVTIIAAHFNSIFTGFYCMQKYKKKRILEEILRFWFILFTIDCPCTINTAKLKKTKIYLQKEKF